jgi:hypothetical protein
MSKPPEGNKITEIVVFLWRDPDTGREGVPYVTLPGNPFPTAMIAADAEREQQWRQMIPQAGRKYGWPSIARRFLAVSEEIIGKEE